jgi:hypothetical protein
VQEVAHNPNPQAMPKRLWFSYLVENKHMNVNCSISNHYGSHRAYIRNAVTLGGPENAIVRRKTVRFGTLGITRSTLIVVGRDRIDFEACCHQFDSKSS